MLFSRTLTLLPLCLLIVACNDQGTTSTLESAESAVEQGDLATALSELSALISADPDHHAATRLRGIVYESLGQTQLASEDYESYLRSSQEADGVASRLGDIATNTGDFQEASQYYSRELRDAPPEGRPLLLAKLGRSYARLARYDSAAVVLEESIAGPNPPAAGLCELARVRAERGQFDDSIKLAQQGLGIQSSNLECLNTLAEVSLQIDEPKTAAEHFAAALDEQPWSIRSLDGYAQALMDLGMVSEAKGTRTRADSARAVAAQLQALLNRANAQPGVTSRWLELARTYIRLGRFEEAQNPLSIARSLDPENLAIQNDLANVALMLGEADKATYWLQRILAADSTLSDVWLNLGVVFAAQQDTVAAQKAWTKALETNPANAEARANLESIHVP